MYLGWESPGGPCEEPNSASLKCGVSNACGTGGYDTTTSCNCGENGATFAGAVPSFEQFSAQQRSAVAASLFLCAIRAALQQSIPPTEWSIPQDCSPNCIGTPANALPLSIKTSTRDVSRIRMTATYSMNRPFNCQGDLGQSPRHNTFHRARIRLLPWR